MLDLPIHIWLRDIQILSIWFCVRLLSGFLQYLIEQFF